MNDLSDAVVVRAGSHDRSAIVVLLHGRGGNENDMSQLAHHLPGNLHYISMRAPLAEASGFSWFSNHGIGRPKPDSLDASIRWFNKWLDREAPDSDVILVGYSGGATFASALLLENPARFLGGALINGNLPPHSHLPHSPGRFGGLTIMLANGANDQVIDKRLRQTAWDYITGPSAAPTHAYNLPGSHEFPTEILADLGVWLQRRFSFAHDHRNEIVDPSRIENSWPAFDGRQLPTRRGSRPAVALNIPQQQLDQNAPAGLQEAIFDYASSLGGVSTHPSVISVPGARAFTLDPHAANGPCEAYIVSHVGEFAHLHPSYDGSLHMALPAAVAIEVVAKGWGAAHPMSGTQLPAGMIMVFGPRNADEVRIVKTIIDHSHQYAQHGSTEETVKLPGVTGLGLNDEPRSLGRRDRP